MASHVKDPSAVKDYGWNWTAKRFPGDTLTSSTWVVPAGLTKVTESFTPSIAIVVLGGGTDGQDYTVTNQVTTAAGRVDELSFRVQVRQR